MNPLLVTVFVYLFTVARAQQVGTQTAEKHPAVNLSKCTKAGGCKCEPKSVTLDANWRWLHEKSGTKNCYTGQTWDPELCKDGDTCATNCALDGADYSSTYGITSTGDALTLKFITGANVGSRVYLMDGDDKYAMFKLKNQEFSFDVDVSNLPCGLNGALYFAEMDEDGGMKKYPSNKAGATYGTGYCDAQCPHDIKFIGGKANVDNWTPSKTDKNTGTGKFGSCCAEMDIWEANKMSQAYTPHTCTTEGPTPCDGAKCGDDPDNRYGGVCDKDGCDFASFRLGATDFYGPNKTVDSTKQFTVVTQFITNDGTAAGDLSEIRRLYVQNGKVIQNTKTKLPGLKPSFDSITDTFCAAEKSLFGDKNDFAAKGGLKSMGGALDRGMVLVMSLWDDHMVDMLWLDSNYPTDKPATTPGVARGTCDAASGDPKVVEAQHPDASVVFSNIKVGDINTTYGSTATGSSSCGASSTGTSTGSSPSTSPTMRRTRKA